VAGKGTVRVVVVDDHDLLRRGLVLLLEGEADMEVVGQARNGASARSEMRRTQPDVVLLEVPTSPFGDPLPADHYAGVEFPQQQWIDLFTDRARRIVVLAQEEARLLNHNYIGTEHILLGLIHEGEGVATKALESLGISLEKVRQQVEEIIGAGQSPPSGHIPFTPRAKKVLELSLREALQLGHNYIGTEHILLGLIREGEGVAAQVLVKLGADLGHVRQQVTRFLSGVSDPTESSHWIPFLRELRDSFPRVGIVALLSDDSTQDLASIALEAGATCYVMKGDPGEKVAFAVREAANLNKPEA
jgi:DNA-binding NarL/FixJ family response regulator